jgi:hypothetical protein
MRAAVIPAAAAAAVLLCAAPAGAVKTSFWTEDDARSFAAGTVRDLVISSRGVVRLSRTAAPLVADGGDITFVNALAADAAGNLYAATAPKGILLKITPDGKAERWLTLPDRPMLFSLSVSPRGDVYVGAGGKNPGVLRVSPEGKPTVAFSDKDLRYFWAMVWDENDHLYAACGTPGRIVRITPDGAAETVFKAVGEKNILSLAYDRKTGHLYAGSDTRGLVYRIATRDGNKPFVLYDAPEAEIGALAVDADGNLIAATSDARGQRGGSAAGAPAPSAPLEGGNVPAGIGRNGGGESAGPRDTGEAGDLQAGDLPDRPAGGTGGGLSGGGAGGGTAGTNAVYRISPEGYVEPLLRAPGVLFLSMVLTPDGILLGTGNDGRLVLLDPATGEHQSLLRARPGQITALHRTEAGRIHLGTANNGGVARLDFGFAKTGELVSRVFDAKLISRWGRVTWDADVPPGTKVRLFTRSGNVAEPSDDAWSPWSPALADSGSPVASPAARFLQYKLVLESADGSATPQVREVRIAYVTENQPPRIKDITVQAAAPAGSGAAEGKTGLPTALTQASLRWVAEDPNADTLVYDVSFREVGDQTWIPLETGHKGTLYRWDTTTVRDGRYEIRVEATDAPDNPGAAKTASRIAGPVTVDNSRPEATIELRPLGRASVEVTVRGKDALSVLTGASYAVDSNTEFTVLLPADGIFDSREETFVFRLENLGPGEHRLAVRLVDAQNNVGHAKQTIRTGK